MRYVKKPIEVEAFQITEHTRWHNEEWPRWLHEAWQKNDNELNSISPLEMYTDGRSSGQLVIVTLGGNLVVNLDDWIIRGFEGGLYPCEPDIFEATYEKVQEESLEEAGIS